VVRANPTMNKTETWGGTWSGEGTLLSMMSNDDSCVSCAEIIRKSWKVRRGFSWEVTFELTFSGYIKKGAQGLRTFL
jgi:hypothetical protein